MLSLFESENQSVRLFGYKLVRLIGKVDLLENLEKIAPNASDEEKIEIIKTYEELGAYMQADFLNQCLLSENRKLQQAAAQAIGVIGNKESIFILENLLKSQPDFPMKMILLKSLQKLDPERFEIFTGIQTDLDTKRIKSHLLDPLLSHV
jgi:HEAT repeat protein